MASTTPVPPTTPERDLDALVRQLDDIVELSGPGGSPLLIGLTADGPGEPADLARPPWRAGAPDDLVAALVGFDAPADWEALAVVVDGRSWDLDRPRTDPRPVRLVLAVDRHGRTASVIRRAGEEPVATGADGEGRLVDTCRRVLGLDTAPPPPTSTGIWARLWLDDLLARLARGEEVGDREAAAASHPAVQIVRDNDPDLLDQAITELVGLGEIQGRARPWPVLRAAAAAGEWAVDDLDPAAAAWMDDGMFARWVTAGFPTVDDYLTELAELLPAPVLDEVTATLRAWSLVD